MADKGHSSVPPEGFGGGFQRNKAVTKPKNMRGTLYRLWAITKGSRKGLEWVLILPVLGSATAILAPYISGRAISDISGGNAAAFIILCLAGIYIVDWLVKFLQQFFMASIGQNIILHIRKILFQKICELPLSFFDKHQRGELMSRLSNDVDNISTTISNSLMQLLTYFFTAVGVLVIMLCMSPVLTIIPLLGGVLIFFFTMVITRRSRKLFLERQKNLGVLNSEVEESISGLSMIKAYCREENSEKKFEEKNEKFRSTSTKALIWSGYLMPLTNVINNLCYLAVAVMSGVLLVNGNITDIGLVASFLLYVREFTRPFVEISNIYNNFQTAVAGAERIFEIIDETTEPEDRVNARSVCQPKGEFKLRHVWFGYNPEFPVLKDISLNIPAGTKVAIVGPTGSGKTTFINLLTRFYDVDSGEILLDGWDLRDYKLRDLRSAYGVVLQDTALFAQSVLENIRYGHQDATEEQVKEAAKMAGADEFICRLPNGMDTVLEQGGMELSQGERQLLTIARAILSNAPILILDEATSSVDTVTEQKIRQAIYKLCEDRTSIIIAHRLSTIINSDLIIMIEQGKVVEQGTHQELMELDGKYAKLYHTQMGT